MLRLTKYLEDQAALIVARGPRGMRETKVAAVLELAKRAAPVPRPAGAAEDDGGVTCDTCNDAQWWTDNFGVFADYARQLWCGPAGLDCPGFDDDGAVPGA